MTAWGRDVRAPVLELLPAPTQAGVEPRILAATRQEVRASVAARIAAFTPEWTNQAPGDAGVALVQVHGTLSESVRVRLNRLPRALLLDHLAIAGVRPLPPRAAAATLAVAVAARAPVPLALPVGTAFVAPGGGDVPTVLETTASCDAVPGRVAAVALAADGLVTNNRPDNLGAGVPPFGAPPRARTAFWVGLDTAVPPEPTLSLAIALAPPATRPAASAAGGLPADAPPLLAWEALVAGAGIALPVERDGTGGLVQSGVVQLRTPADWSATTLPRRSEDPPLRWLRAVLLTDAYPLGARIVRVTLNGVEARAVRTIRDEVATPVGRAAGGRVTYRLSQTPVVPGSVVLDIQDAAADVFGVGAQATATWIETDDLEGAAPEAAVFLLDPAAGELTFGDGLHGRAVPDGYRNVIARSYQVGGGTATLPAPGDQLTSQRSLPTLDGAVVLDITRGADGETIDQLGLRGPEEIRSRGRAVVAADYAALALTTPAVEIGRAHCLPGRDPRQPAGSFPGVVGVVVVPAAGAADGPPVPDPPTLQAVAAHLAGAVGVVGAEVVTVGPRYREIAVQAVLTARVGSDLAALASAARDQIDAWLDPLTGGQAGTGWAFGSPVRADTLTRLLLDRLLDLVAVSSLAFRSNGRRFPACADVPLDDDELTRPGSHRLAVVAEAAAGGGAP